MTGKYEPDRYCRRSIRLPGFDYTSPGPHAVLLPAPNGQPRHNDEYTAKGEEQP